jgi:oligopeptidase B
LHVYFLRYAIAKWLRCTAVAVLCLSALWFAHAEGATDEPPRAARMPHEVRTAFGATRDDPYFWLRDDTRSNPRVLDYLKAENAYADRMLEPLKSLRTAIRNEITNRVPAQDSSVPFLEHGYWYYVRFDQGQNFPVIARKKDRLDSPEEILLDEAKRAPTNGYFSVGNWCVSPDGRLLAWTEDHVGRSQYELYVKNLSTGRILEDSVQALSPNILCGGDNKTILYVVNNKELRPEWLKAHVLGTAADQDRLVYEETDDTFYSMLIRTNDGKYLCLDGFSMVSAGWRCAPENAPEAFTVIARRESRHMYDVDHANGTWYVRTNWKAPNYRVMSVADADLVRGREAWQELVEARPNESIDGMKAFDGYIALEERLEANERVLIRMDDGKMQEIPAPEPAYSMSLSRENNFPTSHASRIESTLCSHTWVQSMAAYSMYPDRDEAAREQDALRACRGLNRRTNESVNQTRYCARDP